MCARKISEDNLIEAFDDGEDMTGYFDFDDVEAVDPAPKRENIAMPQLMAAALDREARRLAISRQALVVTWLADDLERRGALTRA